ncbi:MAG: vWA domain-containing protein [Pseudomonadota bacterium]
MKLTPTSRATTFYESFSDLIFSTMAIFVLLMIIFMALIKANDVGVRDATQAKLVEQGARLADAEAERDRARQQLESMAEQVTLTQSAVTANGLELVVAVDVSASMEQPLGHLVEAVQTIATVLPRITQEFRLGIVAYRDQQDGSPPLEIFPLQLIQAKAKDGGRSYANVQGYLRELEAVTGTAPIASAVQMALTMLQAETDFAGFQTLLLIGDIGPYEVDFDDLHFSAQKQHLEAPIVDVIARWVRDNDKRSVISLFSGIPESMAESTPEQLRSRESLRFFRDIAVAAGQEANFTRNPATMLATLLNAIIQSG